MDRRQFITGAVAAGVAAALPALPVSPPVLRPVSTGGNTLLSPEIIAKEALAHLKAKIDFNQVMAAKRMMDAQPVPEYIKFNMDYITDKHRKFLKLPADVTQITV